MVGVDLRPAIVVVTYSRLSSLDRLLKSLSSAIYEEDFDLYISIDKGNNQKDIIALADNFKWEHGAKIVILRNENLGLKNHIMRCGDLTANHEFLVMLEDDIFVSPFFTKYARKSFDFYGNHKDILGISLYSPALNETTLAPFLSIADSSCYLMQLPCSWGQIWSKASWFSFREWLADNPNILNRIPNNISRWSNKSWKKLQLFYMTDKNKYYLYPEKSYSTNFGDSGEHVKNSTIFQVKLVSFWVEPSFLNFSDLAQYDAWMELVFDGNKIQLNTHVSNVEMDINGSKYDYIADYVITTKFSKNPILRFGDDFIPLELNVIRENYSANGPIVLSHVKDIKKAPIKRLKHYLRIFNVKSNLLFRLLGRY